jgi:glycosyltransferase involved in cell wall biosynthesis
MISVIIPAHDEEQVIGRCLSALLRDAGRDELDVVVVCNGCRDGTAAVARGFGPQVRVIETVVASKSHALNLGDQAARGFPRFYVDADIVVTADAIRAVADVLRHGPFLAASPRMTVDLTDRPWTVRAFYDVWMRLPYCRREIGSGVYGVSREGRTRFDRFPPITADDGFFRLSFRPEQRTVVDACCFTITPPRSVRGIVRIKTRSYFGGAELQRQFPALMCNESAHHGRALYKLSRRPTSWPALLVYGYVKVASRLCGRWRLLRGDHRTWERDDSSRQSPLPAQPSPSPASVAP